MIDQDEAQAVADWMRTRGEIEIVEYPGEPWAHREVELLCARRERRDVLVQQGSLTPCDDRR